MALEDEPSVVHGTISSYTMTPWWLTASGISGNAHKLYAILMHFADNTTLVAWPSRATLAKAMGMNRPQSLDRYIEELVDAGAVQVHRRQAAGGVNLVNQYRMNRGAAPWETSAGNPQEGSAEKRTTSTDERTRVVPESAHELEPMNYNQDTFFEGVPKRGAPSRPLPDDFTVTAAMQSWAMEACPLVDPGAEVVQFIDWHRAKGSKHKDWEAAWRTWMRRAQSYAEERQQQKQAAGSGGKANWW